MLEVERDIAKLFLDFPYDVSLGAGRQAVTTIAEDGREVVREVTPSQVQSNNCVRQRVAFVDRDCVRHAVARVQHESSGATRSVQGQHGLNGDIESWRVEGFE